ncbi:MAG TPA: DUF5671 domain-containing protein [Candidatus Dormibacteraeota bacterium]|nr:DUF5671 domain-containing protein [Candidatus Dormibacteraeota bacterium]
MRRLYLYLVSAAAVLLLAGGLAALGATVLLFVFSDPSADSSRGQLAVFTAMTVVALPVWGIHFWFAQRFAGRDPYERTSALRRLYLYFVCLVASIAAAVAISDMVRELTQPVLDNLKFDGVFAAQAGWTAAVFVAVWGLHFFVAVRDRAAVHEEGTSATLRRWYMYPALLFGLLTMLAGTQGVLQSGWSDVAAGSTTSSSNFSGPLSLVVAGSLIWGFHARAIAVLYAVEDRHSTLRTLEGFIAVTVSIATALFGASQILFYALARALGVSNPGGASDSVFVAAAMPASQLIVYGVAWFLIRRRLARDSATQEADRQAGVRRLYTNLASLVSLIAWGIGAGGLLWTAAEQLEAPIIGVSVPDWKQPLSLWITLLAVGLAVWLTHWRDAPWAADRQSLSRRLYVWASVLGAVLVVIGGGVGMINALFQQLFSAHPRLDDPANLDFGHFLGVIVVAAGIGVYHLRVLRADAAARPPRRKQAVAPAQTTATPAITTGAGAPEALGPHARRYTLLVTDATDDDVHSALANLPPQASYKLSSLETPVDGH